MRNTRRRNSGKEGWARGRGTRTRTRTNRNLAAQILAVRGFPPFAPFHHFYPCPLDRWKFLRLPCGSASGLIRGINGSEFVKNFTKFLATPGASAVWVKQSTAALSLASSGTQLAERRGRRPARVGKNS